MTLITILQAMAQPGSFPWGVVGPAVGVVGAAIGYFIKQDKQIGRQAERIAALEAADIKREAEIKAIKTAISEQMETLRKDLMAEFKIQEKETRDLRERIIRMEERILSGMKRGAPSGP